MANLFNVTVTQINGNPLKRSNVYAFFSADVIIVEDHNEGDNNSYVEYNNNKYYSLDTSETIINNANTNSTEVFEATVVNINGSPINTALRYGFPVRGVLLTSDTSIEGANTCIYFNNKKYYVSETVTAIVAEANSGLDPVSPITPANPSAVIGLTAINGNSTQFMRSDAAPPIDQDILPVWTGIHTFSANPVFKNVLPNLNFQNNSNEQLGFINFGTGVANIPSFIQVLKSSQLRIVVGLANNATYTFGDNGQIGLGNPVTFGTTGQVLKSGGASNPASWGEMNSVVASDGRNAQAANVNAPTFYAVPTSGMYRVSAFVVLSQAATTSSTLPGCSVSYTEATTGVAVQDIITLSANTNLVGLHVGGSVVISAQQGSNIGYTTSGYATSGATGMQYSIHIKIEFLG